MLRPYNRGAPRQGASGELRADLRDVGTRMHGQRQARSVQRQVQPLQPSQEDSHLSSTCREQRARCAWSFETSWDGKRPRFEPNQYDYENNSAGSFGNRLPTRLTEICRIGGLSVSASAMLEEHVMFCRRAHLMLATRVAQQSRFETSRTTGPTAPSLTLEFCAVTRKYTNLWRIFQRYCLLSAVAANAAAAGCAV